MKTNRPLLSVILLFTFFPVLHVGAHKADELPHDPVAIAEELISAYNTKDLPGGVVLVMRDGSVIFQEAFGMANLTHGVPFAEGTPTNIGSTSKQFTVFGLLLLKEQGKLSLEDDIRLHIPELPDFGDTVRIRHLVSHTSGYREYINSMAMGGRYLTDNIRRAEIIPLLQRQPSLQNKPGASFNYNNSGYALLAMVIERITEESFSGWMRKHVFEPLGMHNTLVIESPGQLIPGKAQGYSVGPDNQIVVVSDLHASMGAGGIYSTIGDLEIWIRNFHNPIVGSPETIDRMQQAFPLNSGESTQYAGGLMVRDLNGLLLVEHGGADTAHRSALLMFPGIKGAVVVQSNNSRLPAQAMAIQLAEAFFADVMELDKEARKSLADGEVFVYDATRFDEFIGRYELEAAPGFVMEFTREEDKLYAQATGQPRFEIFASSDSIFYLTVVEASMTFHRNQEGEVDAMTLHQSGNHRAIRLNESAWEPSPEELAEYLGAYFSAELETFYTVAINDEGAMVLQHRRFKNIPLKAESNDQYTGGFPIMEIKFVRDEAGVVTGFEASSSRSFGIVFEKQPQ